MSHLYDTTNPDWVPSQTAGYTLSKAPDSEWYTRLEQRKIMRVLDVEEGSDHEEMKGVVSETGVACQASVVVVDGKQADIKWMKTNK